MASKNQEITTVTKAAERLGCSRQNVLYLLAKGKLTGTLIGPKCWAIDVVSVDKYEFSSIRKHRCITVSPHGSEPAGTE